MWKDNKLVSCTYFGLHSKHRQWIFNLISLLVHSVLKRLCELQNLLSTDSE